MINSLNVTDYEKEHQFLELTDETLIEDLEDMYFIRDLNERMTFFGPNLSLLIQIFERNFNVGYSVSKDGMVIIDALYNPVEQQHYSPKNYMVTYICQDTNNNVIFQTDSHKEFYKYIRTNDLYIETHNTYSINILGDIVPYALDVSITGENVLPF